MTQITLTHRIEELTDLEKSIEELKAEAEAIRDQIKDEMTSRGLEQLVVGDYVIKYLSVLTSRFDTKRFKEEIGESVYREYCKEVASKRFTITH